MSNDRSFVPPPPLVAVVAWLVPGAGYFVLGQRSRAYTVGVSILVLFILGLLIAGVRVIEVPGYDASGEKMMVNVREEAGGEPVGKWIMYVAPVAEIRNKPWSVPQVLTGPVSLLAAAWSVHESGADPDRPGMPRGDQSHARLNEIGSLYLSVAGLLNLLAIIDSSHRAGQRAAE